MGAFFVMHVNDVLVRPCVCNVLRMLVIGGRYDDDL